MDGPGESARLEIRRARWQDLREVHRSYRAQPASSRELYHPFPFGSARLSAFLLALWGTSHAGRTWAHVAPRSAAVLFVARDRDDGSLAGYGTVRLRRNPAGRLVARTGLFVLPDRRRAGVGRGLKEALLAHARSLGAERAEAFLLPTNTASAELNRQLGFHLRPATSDDPPEAQGHLIAEGDLEAPPRSLNGRPASLVAVERGAPNGTGE